MALDEDSGPVMAWNIFFFLILIYELLGGQSASSSSSPLSLSLSLSGTYLRQAIGIIRPEGERRKM